MKPPEFRPISDDQPLEDNQFDDHLGDLFAAARTPSAADLGAADRFLSNNPALGAPALPTRARPALRYWPAALAIAAALSGVLVLRPAPAELPSTELPSTAAYDAYASALGSDW